jgi:hypothetical protein
VTISKIILKFISVCPSLSMHNGNLMLCDDIQDYSNNRIRVVMIVLYCVSLDVVGDRSDCQICRRGTLGRRKRPTVEREAAKRDVDYR